MQLKRSAWLAVAACTLGGSGAIPVLVIGSAAPAAAVSFNPGAASKFHAPVSAMGIAAINGTGTHHSHAAARAFETVSAAHRPVAIPAASGVSSIPLPPDIIRFNTDTSYVLQTEPAVAVDPANRRHVVGGFNDFRIYACPALPPGDCPSGYTQSRSGFSTSADGGHSVAVSDAIPGVTAGSGTTADFLAPFGDPEVAPTVDGNFYYASLAIDAPLDLAGGNGVELSVSNSKLWSNPASCTTPLARPASNPCWSSTFVFGFTGTNIATFEDKDMIAVDRDPTSPFFGDAYIGWDHFNADGTSAAYLARCTQKLHCTMLSGGGQPALSGGDPFVYATTPVVDSAGNVHVTWCNLGTATTFAPLVCKVASSGPGGTSFGAPVTILTTSGFTLGFATEQFKAVDLPVLAVDTSPTATNGNLYFTIDVCTTGDYYDITGPNTPGDCGASAVLFSSSTDAGATWSTPVDVSALAPSSSPGVAPADAVTVQPWVTVDQATGEVDLLYYTSQFDPFDHRLDVEAAGSANAGRSWTFSRITPTSIEPDSDPNYFDDLNNGYGGSFGVPQFGDYFEAVALNGTLWTSFNATYTAEEGTFQTDPYLAVTPEP